MEEAREEAERLYKTFYNYSDLNIEVSFEYKAAKELFKYFYENYDKINEIKDDETKGKFLEDFYQQCL